MRNRLVVLLFVLLMLTVSGLVMAQDVIKIGVNEPMTGPFAVGGKLVCRVINWLRNRTQQYLVRRLN